MGSKVIALLSKIVTLRPILAQNMVKAIISTMKFQLGENKA